MQHDSNSILAVINGYANLLPVDAPGRGTLACVHRPAHSETRHPASDGSTNPIPPELERRSAAG
jgi:hypothetical protein